MRLPEVLVACLALGSVLPAAAEPAGFRFWREIDRGGSRGEEIVAFTLDGGIYAATRDGWPDLRVLDAAGVETPYQIEPEEEYFEQRTRETFPTEVLSLREEGGTIEIRLRLPEDSPAADGFSFATPLADYERKVRVFGSNDGADWALLAADGIIFDYSRYMDLSNRDVPLPPNRFRQFKIAVENVTDEKESPYKELTRTFRGGKEDRRVERTTVERRPLRIDRITAWNTVTRQHVQRAKKAVYPAAAFDVQQDAAKKQTVVQVRPRREPLVSLTLETPSRNFSRRAVVEAPLVRGVTTEWLPIGEAVVSDFRFRAYRRNQLTIAFPERRQQQYRIVIHNEDNPPLDLKGVKPEGNVYRAVFLAQESKTYRVFYGSETAEAPKYEAATVLAALRRDYTPVEATLGPQTENAAFGGEPALAVRRLLNNWVFLGAVICLMVAVLAWGLFRAGRRLEGLPRE